MKECLLYNRGVEGLTRTILVLRIRIESHSFASVLFFKSFLAHRREISLVDFWTLSIEVVSYPLLASWARVFRRKLPTSVDPSELKTHGTLVSYLPSVPYESTQFSSGIYSSSYSWASSNSPKISVVTSSSNGRTDSGKDTFLLLKFDLTLLISSEKT